MKPEVVFGLESASWPALLLNAGSVVVRTNAAATAAFGAALTGEAPTLSAIWLPENGGTPEEFLARCEQLSKPTTDVRLRTANGATTKFTAAVCAFSRDGARWYVLQLLPAVERTPGPAGASDESKTAPDAGAASLKQKLDCALQLARTVSLDFNNALTSVLGHTSLLLSKAEPGHPWRHSLMEVEKSAQHAAEIASELQTFSRQEKETHRAQPGNLNAVANRCVEFFRNVHGAEIAWNVQLEKNPFAVRFDEAMVQQALTKILENAVEAISQGRKGHITVQTRNAELTEPTQDRNVRLAAGTYVCVEITDDGSGIEPGVLPRIFDPFFTTKKGTHRGLGLALVYGIVTNHGGGVAISSQPGVGTSARVYLPAEKNFIPESTGVEEDLHGTQTVLVVDDESLLLTMAETILTDFGYKVLTVNSGQKALEILSRGDVKADVVVTDLVMPGMSGRELVERIRQLAPTMRILCTSGYMMPVDKQTGAAYLQKPFTSAELLAKVKHVLANKNPC
jgi:signal transduction histidine kinase